MKHFYKSILLALIILIIFVGYTEAILPIIGVVLRTIATRFITFTSRFGALTSRLVSRVSGRQIVSQRYIQLSRRRVVSRRYTKFSGSRKVPPRNRLINKRIKNNQLLNAKLRGKYVKPDLTNANAAIYEGIGGDYGTLKDVVSSKFIEADHFPATSLYQHSPKFSHLSKGKQPAISLTKKLHLKTGSWGRSGYSKNFRASQKMLIKNDNWKEALEMSIEDYQMIAGNDLNAGMRHALKVHKQIGTITKSEYKHLINKYKLKDIAGREYYSVKLNSGEEIMSGFHGRKQGTLITKESLSVDLGKRQVIEKYVMKKYKKPIIPDGA